MWFSDCFFFFLFNLLPAFYVFFCCCNFCNVASLVWTRSGIKRNDFPPLVCFGYILTSFPVLPLSFSHSQAGTRTGDMWHSDICHLAFAPTDAFLRVNQKAGKVTLCAQCSFHTFHSMACYSLFLTVIYLFLVFNWYRCVSFWTALVVWAKWGAVQCEIPCRTVNDILGEEGALWSKTYPLNQALTLIPADVSNFLTYVCWSHMLLLLYH